MWESSSLMCEIRSKNVTLEFEVIRREWQEKKLRQDWERNRRNIQTDYSQCRGRMTIDRMLEIQCAGVKEIFMFVWSFAWDTVCRCQRDLHVCSVVCLVDNNWCFLFDFVDADTQLYKRICPSIRWSIHGDLVEKWKKTWIRYFLCMFVCWEVEVWMEVGCPCRPVRNYIVSLCHLLML